MRLLSSLRGRVFLASALVALACAALALRLVSAGLEATIDRDLQAGLERSERLLLEQHRARVEALATVARLVADLPRLKAAVETGDAPTVEPLAREYQAYAGADLLHLSDAAGRTLARLGPVTPAPDAVARALRGHEAASLVSEPAGLFEVVSVPVSVGPGAGDVLGTLSVGLALDRSLARRLGASIDGHAAILEAGRVRASSLEGLDGAALAAAPAGSVFSARADGEEYVALKRPLHEGADGPWVVALRSRTERLRVLGALRVALLVALALSVGLGVALSWAVARSVTRPLDAITAGMRRAAATGDLGQALELRGAWVDEDARTLASTFNGLLEALDRFRREHARRERLESLGRLSTVIAHELRNPLMIIRSALPALRTAGTPEPERAEAWADVDAETRRIDRIVGDVLDFAREVRVEPRDCDLAPVVREACEVALERHGAAWAAQLDPRAGPAFTDPERVRQVLLALLDNAREASAEAGPPAPAVEVRLAREGGRLSIEVADRGPGLPPDTLAQVFEPYFTTKRRGTGLGLAIARNVSEALGGHLGARPREGGGAVFRLDLPASLPGPGR